MRVSAIIPIRGGSKGVKDKGIIPINGVPLAHYCIDALMNTNHVNDIVVTTDSKTIAEVVKDKNEDIIIIDRPDELATDSATSEVALVHAIEQLDFTPDIILFVQATSPLTEASDYDNLISALVNRDLDCTAYCIKDRGFFFGEDIDEPRLPRQEKKPRYREVGNAWAFKTKGFMEYKCRTFGNVGIFEMESPKHYEIDTMDDVKIISCLLKEREKDENSRD